MCKSSIEWNIRMTSFNRVNKFHILIKFQKEKKRDIKNQIYTEIKTYKC